MDHFSGSICVLALDLDSYNALSEAIARPVDRTHRNVYCVGNRPRVPGTGATQGRMNSFRSAQMSEVPPYLLPYHRAARTHGSSFSSLLWASESTQRIRFEILQRAVDFTGRTICDAGCGRADLLDFLIA